MSGHRQDRPDEQSSEQRALIALAFAPALGQCDLRQLLRHLNALVPHRFTGVYRFEPGWVMSVALWDRENPTLETGANVKMKESYCWLTGLDQSCFVIEDACVDPRLVAHAARDEVRAYAAVVLRDRQLVPWGTLCHFDFQPRQVPAGTIDQLELYRPLIEEMLVRDRPAHWDPDASSSPLSVS
jgi:hypothetical protein